MRSVPPSMLEGWRREDKTGPYRPVVRATIQRANLRRWAYDTTLADGSDYSTRSRNTVGHYTSIIFGDYSGLLELRNIKGYTWTRSIDQDVATATMTIKNTDLTPIGNQDRVEHASDFDMPGYFTYNRGEVDDEETNPWGYESETGYHNLIVPDRLIRTYEGYGADRSVAPHRDPNLVQSGMWLIDKVTYTADGDIQIEMRDIGRLLLNQIVFPPAVPYGEYPLSWQSIASRLVDARSPFGGTWKWGYQLGSADSSNKYYIGKGLSDPPYSAFVTKSGGWNNHYPSMALRVESFEPYRNPYWASTGHTSEKDMAWWQLNLSSGQSVAGLRINPFRGPYRVYVSLYANGKWVGKKLIPYDADNAVEGIDIGARIPFVTSVWADRFNRFEIPLPRIYRNVTKIRFTFTRLWDSRVGNYPFRAGLQSMQVYTGANGFKKGKQLRVVGNYHDYTDIVRQVCAWAGWWWPEPDSGDNFWRAGDGILEQIDYAHRDYALVRGRVWGNFMRSGTTGVADLGVDLFDKKPLMDVINYVRDLLGFVFFIDETGGVVWRMPNLWEKGNYVSPSQSESRLPVKGRTSQVVTLHEEETLFNYSTTLNSDSIRERIFVGNTTGKTGVVIRGFVPTKAGFRRVAGWTDQHFNTTREARVMADMIAAKIMFEYRRSDATIPGNPQIQIDDQVRIYERTTNETYYHRVMSISSDLNMETGEWTYQLNTHWLGHRPEDAWVVDSKVLARATRAYLNLLEPQRDIVERAYLGPISPPAGLFGEPQVDYDTLAPDPDSQVTADSDRLLGIHDTTGTGAVLDYFHRYPDIASRYLEAAEEFPMTELQQMLLRGIVPLVDRNTQGTQRLQGIADDEPTDLAWMDSYVAALHQLSLSNPSLGVYATLDADWAGSVSAGEISGSSATVAKYAAALTKFIQAVHADAPYVKVGLWYGRQDSSRVSAILTALNSSNDSDGRPDWIAFNEFSGNAALGTETPGQAWADRLAYLRGNANYSRLGSPPIGVGEFAMSVGHGDDALARYYSYLRNKMTARDVAFALLQNQGDTWNITQDSDFQGARAAFAASLAATAYAGPDDGNTNLGNSATVAEPSASNPIAGATGIAVSRTNTAGGRVMYAVLPSSQAKITVFTDATNPYKVLGTHTINNASTGVKFEDLCMGFDYNGDDVIWVAATGADDLVRSIYAVREQDWAASQTSTFNVGTGSEEFTLTAQWPSYKGLAQDPETGDLYLFGSSTAPERPAKTPVWRIPFNQLQRNGEGGEIYPQRITQFLVSAIDSSVADQPVSADFSADGKYLVLSNTQELFVWEKTDSAMSWYKLLLDKLQAPTHKYYDGSGDGTWGCQCAGWDTGNDPSSIFGIATGGRLKRAHVDH